MNKNGFTLVDTMVTVTVVGVLASIAIPHYHSRVAKAQTSKAMSLIDAEKVNVTQYMLKKNGCGTISNNPVEGKYGSIEVTGNLKSDAVQYPNTLQGTGCLITYTFKSDGVSKRLAGKKITAELFNNSTLSKNTSTDVGAEYLSPVFVAQVSDPVVKPTITTETPLVAKDTVLIPVEAGTPEADPVYKLNITKDYKNLTTTDAGYYLKPSINLYDYFVEKASRAPEVNEKIEIIVEKDVAVLGFTNVPTRATATAAMVVDNRWPKVNLTIVNYGLIAGHGSRGGKNNSGSMRDGGNGGTALQNSSGQRIYANNYGILAGGGGGAQIAVYGSRGWTSAGGGGGAPYGEGGDGNKGSKAPYGSLLYGGSGYKKGDAISGAGGNLGQDGSYGVKMNKFYEWYPGKAGATTTGDVVLTNLSGGKTKL